MVEIPTERLADFMQLVERFKSGNVDSISMDLGINDKTYLESMADLIRGRLISHVLRQRLSEDDNRSRSDSLNDAEVLHAIQAKRYAQEVQLGVVSAISDNNLEADERAALE